MEQQIKNFLKAIRLNESLVSTLLGIGVVVVVGALLYNYFSNKPSAQPENLDLTGLEQPETTGESGLDVEIGEAPQGLPVTHQVQKGEHLWAIAEKYYGSGYNWTDIAAANNLGNADRITEGMELTIPSVPAKQRTVSESPTPADAQQTTVQGDKYTVAAGDSLWTIAVKVYADGYQWPKLWEANRDKIGGNPNQLEKGLELSIPK